ncbi:GNAT family N-acetyltransferase [Mariniflexile ostreae]|uniref:GNAT family N-acetyltransferase n=1 Tax=Mariniflexile ostreae TaxID=1520892 RepID=A0ABV5F8S0_9FLAO
MSLKCQENSFIRKATKSDSKGITDCLFLALETFLCKFIGVNDSVKAKHMLLHFVNEENNQYSFQNCYVAEIDGMIAGAINSYNGAHLNALKRPIANFIQHQIGTDFNPEPETTDGEYYIDSFGILPRFQGKGIGTQLLKHLIHEHRTQNRVLGLLVEENNQKAETLYLALGFKWIKNQALAGKNMRHLQLKP